MNRGNAVLIFATAFAAGLFAQEGDRDLLRSIDHVLGNEDRAPTIDDVLGDTLGRLRGVDTLSARAIAARLRENEAELKLYESLLRQVRAGVLVDVPRPGAGASPASPEAVAEERRRVDELTRQLRDAEAVRSGAVESRPRRAEGAPAPSRISDALLDVSVDVPNPPEKKHAVLAADPANLSRALFVAGDWAGTLAALDQIAPEAQTPEQKFRRARALDQLGRMKEARAAYEAVVLSEKDGAFGRQAAWMLRLARTREQVAGAVGAVESPPHGGKKK
jgi:hypothetical protein